MRAIMRTVSLKAMPKTAVHANPVADPALQNMDRLEGAPIDMCSAEPVPELFFALGISLFELRNTVAPSCTLSILPER